MRPADPRQKEMPVLLPRVITFRTEPKHHLSSEIVGHELDHWDLALHGAAAIHQDHSYPDVSWLKVFLEKRAYRTSYTIDRTLGAQAVASVAEVAQEFKGYSFLRIKELHLRLLAKQQEAGSRMDRLRTVALTVLVAEQLFGNPREPVTYEELAALGTLGLIS